MIKLHIVGMYERTSSYPHSAEDSGLLEEASVLAEEHSWSRA